jgi:glyoxylase-like metal-dependent hydrolase (beta-lactamase superfamily II)
MSNPTLVHLTETIYAYPGEMRLTRPWIGIVVTSEGTVLLDSGNGPTHAAEIQAALDELAAPPVTHILLTHHHWDHHFGSGSFPGATVVAHELTQRHLQVMAGEPWSTEYVMEKGESFPRGKLVSYMINKAVPDWLSFRVVPAQITFTDRYDLSLGGYHFLMEHVGGEHEPDQSIIHVTPGDVLFLGDATYGRGPQETWNNEALAAAMQGFLDRGAAWFIEGHRSPVRRDSFRRRIERLGSAE